MSMTRPTEPNQSVPSESFGSHAPQALRSVPMARLSCWLIPRRLRYRAIDVSVRICQTPTARGQPVVFRVVFHNQWPLPIAIPVTQSPPWTWTIAEQQAVAPTRRRERATPFQFRRGERKQFVKRWGGTVHPEEDRWRFVDPGLYTIRVTIATPDDAGLVDTATVRIGE